MTPTNPDQIHNHVAGTNRVVDLNEFQPPIGVIQPTSRQAAKRIASEMQMQTNTSDLNVSCLPSQVVQVTPDRGNLPKKSRIGNLQLIPSLETRFQCFFSNPHSSQEQFKQSLINGDLEAVRACLHRESDPFTPEVYEVIFQAAINENLEIFRLLLADSRFDPMLNNEQVLQNAITYNQLELVRLFMQDPQHEYSYCEAFALAAHLGHLEIVVLLLETVEFSKSQIVTALGFPEDATLMSVAQSLSQMNDEASLQDSLLQTVFLSAATCVDVEALEFLIGFNTRTDFSKVLKLAVQYNQDNIGEKFKFIEKVIRHFNLSTSDLHCLVEEPEESEQVSLLDWSIDQGHIIISVLLLRTGVFNLSPEQVDTLLSMVVGYGNEGADRVELLRLIYPYLEDQDVLQEVFNAAATMGHVDVVAFFLTKAHDKIQLDYRENTLICNVSEFGHADVLKLLVEHGNADPAARGNLPLLSASLRGHLEVVDLLLSYPTVDPRVTRAQEFAEAVEHASAIENAASRGHLDVVQRLLLDSRLNTVKNYLNAIDQATNARYMHVTEALKFGLVDLAVKHLVACVQVWKGAGLPNYLILQNTKDYEPDLFRALTLGVQDESVKNSIMLNYIQSVVSRLDKETT